MNEHNEDKGWERISELLRDADCVPNPPDCREWVMSRITRPRRSLAWAYACAALVIAVAASALLLPDPAPKSPAPQLAKKQPVTPKKIAQQPPIIEKRSITRAPRKPVVANATPLASRPHRLVARTHVRPAPRPHVPKPEPAPIVVRTPAPPAVNAQRPIAIAIVTWPSANDSRADSYSYSYKDRDTTTGQTTECRVKRSGDSVDIYMESKPEVQQPPVKGSVEHGTKPSA